MSKKFLEVGDTTADGFAKASGEQRRRLRKRRIWEAEWDRDPTPVGEVVFHMRERARASQARAFVFLVLLFVSVVAGLAYFVAVPIYRDWVARQANDARLEAEAALNAEAAALVGTFEQLKAEATAAALDRWKAENQSVDLRSVFFLDESLGWIVGVGGAIFSTTDGGENWIPRDAGTNVDLFSVTFADAQNGWAVGRLGTILSSNDGGVTWVGRDSQTNEQLNAVDFADALSGWAVGAEGTILATTNGGALWNPQISGTDATLLSVNFTSPRNGWAVGSGGAAVSTKNGGASWEVRNVGLSGTLRSVEFIDDRTGWIAGERAIYSTQDQGATWTDMKADLPAGWFSDIEFVDGQVGWALEFAGELKQTTNGGSTWSRVRNLVSFFWSLSFPSKDVGWMVGDRGLVLKIEGASSVVEQQFLGVPEEPPATSDWFGGPIVQAEDAFALQSAFVRSGVRMAGEDDGDDGFQAKLSSLLGQQAELEKRRAELPIATTTLADQAVDAAAEGVRTAKPDEREAAMAVFDAALRQKANESVWWQKLDEQIPAGILLLFLLATLGSLYRYNTRIAGFYHGRADALELMAQEVSEEQLEKMANALGADQVEFKQTKTPADMATEVAKEVIAKLNLKSGT